MTIRELKKLVNDAKLPKGTIIDVHLGEHEFNELFEEWNTENLSDPIKTLRFEVDNVNFNIIRR
jgi:hypothetical protein